MAFVSRSERNLNFARKDQQNIGPGAYLGHSDFKPKLCTGAPFSSKSQRSLHVGGSFAPGPGQYTHAGQFESLVKKNESEGKNSTMNGDMGIFAFLKTQPVGFSTSANRFKDSNVQKMGNPGPGSYDPSKDVGKLKVKSGERPEWQQMAMVRLPNAPSIPSHNNVFGYEETHNGELVQQQNPEKYFTGEGTDKIGPGHYDRRDPAPKITGTNWHASKVNRFTFGSSKGTATVGPGSYELDKRGDNTRSRKKGTSCFVSAVPKSTGDRVDEYARRAPRGNESEDDDEEEIDDTNPGPGSYNPRNPNQFESSYVPGYIQQFGATAPRFAQGRTAVGNTLGPGQYGDFRQGFKPKRKNCKVPFLSSEKKNENKKILTEVPGPGQYAVKGIKDDINKKVWGKQGAFGCTERRFAQLTSMKTPGPGSHNAEEALKNINQHTSSAGPSRFFQKPLPQSKKRLGTKYGVQVINLYQGGCINYHFFNGPKIY